MEHRSILVTGAGGLIGSYAIRDLYSRGYEVIGLYRNKPTGSFPWKTITANLASDPLEYVQGVEKKIYGIVHCAASLPAVSPSESVKTINRQIDDNVISFVNNHPDIKLVYTSGTSLYGTDKYLYTEDSQPDPKGEYLLEKYITENLISQKISHYYILRISAPYSPQQKIKTVLGIFIDKAISNQPITYHGTGSRQQDFTAAEDAARAISNCFDNNRAPGVYNIASGRSITMKDLAHLVVAMTPGCKSDVYSSGQTDDQEGGKANYSIDKARELLNWKPEITLEQGINNWILFAI